MPTILNETRRLIASFNKREFSTLDLPKRTCTSYMINRLLKTGEIEEVGKTKIMKGRKETRIFREVRVSFEEKQARVAKSITAWSRIYPEFFKLPKFKVRSSKTYKGE